MVHDTENYGGCLSAFALFWPGESAGGSIMEDARGLLHYFRAHLGEALTCRIYGHRNIVETNLHHHTLSGRGDDGVNECLKLLL